MGLLGVSSVTLFSAQAWAGAWNLPKGDGQIILTNVWSSGTAVFDEDGRRQPITDFSKTESRLFFEHGLTGKITLTGNAAYQTINFDSPQDRFVFKDFDQTELGLRYQLKSKPGQAVSVQASYILDGGPRDNILDIDGGRDQIEVRGLWGQSTDRQKNNLFADVQLASRFDVGGRYDATHFDVTLGYKPDGKWLFMLQNYTATREPESDFGFNVGRQSQWKIQPSITYHYGRKKKRKKGEEAGLDKPRKRNHSLQIAYTKTILGQNLVEEEGVTIGYWWRY